MNKIEELEKQLNEEISKIQVNLKEKHKWIVGKYVKYNDSLIARIDDIHHIPMLSKNGYTNYLKSDDFIFVNGTVVRYSVNSNCYSLAKDRWEYKNSQSDCFKQSAGYFFSCHTISAIFLYQNTN